MFNYQWVANDGGTDTDISGETDATYTLVADAEDRIREHRERKEKLEVAAEEARAMLSERRVTLDKVETITAYAEELSEVLRTSEITESRAFIRSFVKEIEVRPGRAVIHYTIPTPEDSPIGRADTAEMVLNGGVMSTVRGGGPKGTRTPTLDVLM